MRKDRYELCCAQHIAAMKQVVHKFFVDRDEINDVLSLCLKNIFVHKTYSKIKSAAKLRSFLRRAVRFECLKYQQTHTNQKMIVSRLPDDETYGDHVIHVPVLYVIPPVVECPFCFLNNLNEYGACNMCGTIVPTYFRNHRNAISMTENSLAVEFDFNKQIDVAKAIARLTPKEQMVVKAIGLGNETLESLATLHGTYQVEVWRIWLHAKKKLQAFLLDYAHEQGVGRVSKRSSASILRAFQAIKNDNV